MALSMTRCFWDSENIAANFVENGWQITDAEAEADSFFPDLDRREDWVLDSQSEEKEHEGLRYRFCTYVRK